MKHLFLTLFTFLFAHIGYSQNWKPLGQGLNNAVNTIIADKTSTIIYAAGYFTASGNKPLNHIAYWDGIQWNELGQGLNNTVTSLAQYQGELYAIGNFTASGTTQLKYIAKWDGTTWKDVGGGLNKRGLALFTHNGELYAGGAFTKAGSQTCKYIAKWNGQDWQALDTNIASINSAFAIKAISSFQNNIVIGGHLTVNSTSNNIAILKNGKWQAMGTGTNSYITSILEVNNELFVTGFFNNAGGKGTVGVAKWDGSAWHGVLGPMSSLVECSALVNNNIVFGGPGNAFLNGNVSDSPCITSYNLSTSNWSGVSKGMDNRVGCITTHGNQLYAGGLFDTAGLAPIQNIAMIDVATLGFESNFTNESIKIFPNPFTDKAFIDLSNTKLDSIFVQLFTIDGREITTTINYKSTVIEIERGQLTQGVYIVKLWSNLKLIGEQKLIVY